MMDIEGQAVQLGKKIEKLDWQIKNDVSTEKQKEKKEKQIKELQDQIEADWP